MKNYYKIKSTLTISGLGGFFVLLLNLIAPPFGMFPKKWGRGLFLLFY